MNIPNLVGSAFLAGMAVSVLVRAKRKARLVKTVGTVISLGPSRPGEDGMIPAIYFPVIKFPTEAGEVVCEEVKLNDFGPKVVGDSVTVLYDPTRPREFCNARTLVYYRFELIGCIVGIALCIWGGYSINPPNQSLEPTTTSVMNPAEPGFTPAAVVAHL